MKTPLTSLRHALLVVASGLALSHTAAAQILAPAVQWDKAFGGTGDDQATVVQATADGGFIVGGTSPSGITGNKTQASFGGNDYWVVKLDAAGNKTWDYTFGGSGNDQLTSLQQNADGSYIVGGQSTSGVSGSKTRANQGGSDLWLLKLSATGTKVWDKSYGSAGDDLLYVVRPTADGGYIVGARSDSGINGDRSTAGNGSYDYWVLKLDATGAKTWDKSYGGSSNEDLRAIQPTRNGGYVIGGFSYSGISGDKSEGVVGGGSYDFWVIKITATGTKVWDRTFGGSDYDQLTSMEPASDGGFVAAGFSSSPVSGTKTQGGAGNADFWAVKFDSLGTKSWDHTYGGTDYDQLNSIKATADHGFIMGGFSQSGAGGDRTQANFGAAGGQDYWVVKVDSMGVKQWNAAFGGALSDGLNSVSQVSDGGYILAGRSASNASVAGSKSQATFGSNDFWVLRLRPAVLAAASAHSLAPLGLYPNPAHRSFSVQVPADAPHTGLRLELLDVTGRLVWQQGVTGTSTVQLPATQPAGLYVVRLQGPTGYQQTQRLVIE